MGWRKDLKASWMLRPFSGQRRKQRMMLSVPLWIDLQQRGFLFILFALFSIIHNSCAFGAVDRQKRRRECDGCGYDSDWAGEEESLERGEVIWKLF